MKRRKQMMQDLDQEIREHIAIETQDNIERGMSPEAARYAALRKFGNVARVNEETWGVWSFTWFEQLLDDVRFGARTLRKNPGFAIVAVLTLALGIGANTAIFSVVEGVVLAPLPFRQADRLVVVWQKNLTHKYVATISYLDFLDWQRSAQSFQRIAGISWQGYDLTSPGTAQHFDGNRVSSGFFSTLGVKPALGREFSEQEDQEGGSPAVILSDRLWRSRFGASPKALGKFVSLDGMDYTVVGVLPPGFRFLTDADVYLPLGQNDPLIMSDRTIHGILPIARLKPGVSMVQAQAEMKTVQEDLDHVYPGADRGLEADVVALKTVIVGDSGATLLLLLGSVGIVLLIACANVANLLLARSAARRREFAVRSALGAQRTRIVRQLVTESLLLSLAGGALGLLVAKGGIKVVLAAVPGNLPRSENIGLHLPVLLFTFGVSIAVGILFGLAPALQNSRIHGQSSLQVGGRGSTSTHQALQSALVVVQISLTLVLLVGAVLLFRTTRRLLEVDPGFEAKHVITFKVGLSPSVTKTPSSLRTAYQQLVERIRRVPGIQAADLTNLVPLSNQDNSGAFWVGSRDATSMAEAPHALYYETGPDYLRTMQLSLLRGRFFTPQDTTDSEPVIVIDSVLAHAYFPNRDPVGQTITVAHWRTAQIIGVVGHVRHWELGNPRPYTQNQIYISFYQLPDEWVPLFYPDLRVAVRTPLSVAAVMPAIRNVIYGSGKDQPVYSIEPMQDLVSDSMSAQRFPMILLGAFAFLALVLACVGLYGVISYSVTQRVQEIGIRMALGAAKQQIVQMVIRQALRLALAGLIIGSMAALLLTRLLTSFSHLLYGVGRSDPATFGAVSLLLIGVAILACYIPARRASRVDPMVALRYE
jgi:predicted permease